MLIVAPDSKPVVGQAHVALCGALVARIGGRSVEDALPGRKGRQLFAYLVVSRHRAMSRDELIDAVWPNAAPADPDGAFATLLTRLRTALGRDVVLGRSELSLDIGEDAWVDWEVARAGVTTAEERLAAGDAGGALEVVSAALEIARRPILPGVSTPWLEDRRRELFEARAALLETGGRAALDLGGDQLPVAERSARELIELEPYRETAYGLLMETHAARGNVAEALRVFDALRGLLREELGMSPSPPLSELAGRLLENDAPPAAVVSTGAPAPCERIALPPAVAASAERPLAGRRTELRGLLAHVLERRSGLLAVTGEAGIGKSRLAAEVAARAHAEGCEVLHGRCERAGAAPHQPLVDALRRRLAADDAIAHALTPTLRPELAELARAVPELRRAVAAAPDADDVEPEVRRRRTASAVAGLCGEIARRRPLLVVLDDLQWADEATLLLLRRLVHSLQGVPATFLVTFSDDEQLPRGLRGLLLDLLRERVLDRVVLGGLDEADTGELMTWQSRAVPDQATLRKVHVQTGGNPFLVEELVRAGDASGGLPAGVRDAVELRLERLDAATCGVLEVAAATGQSFDVATVAGRVDAPRAATRGAVREAVRAGLVVAHAGRPGRFAFRNGIVRRALLER